MTTNTSVDQMIFMDRLYRTPAKRRTFEEQTQTEPLSVGQAGFDADRDSGHLHSYRDRFWGWAAGLFHART